MKSGSQPRVTLDVDLTFSVDTGSDVVSGTVQSAGNDVTVFVDDPTAFLARGTLRRGAVPGFVGTIAKEGMTVTVEGPNGVIASVGAVRPSFLSALLSGSKHVRLGRLTTLIAVLRQSSRSPRIAMPPTTMSPLVPTIGRRIRRRVTTTHYLRGSGNPRLIFVVGSAVWDGKPPREFSLLEGVTTIGSGVDADLRLEGLKPIHAEIHHDENDDYVVYLVDGSAEEDRAKRAGTMPKPGRILRTGARIELANWRMGFFREEFADHGRPYGGRIGGELARQKRQPGPRGQRA